MKTESMATIIEATEWELEDYRQEDAAGGKVNSQVITPEELLKNVPNSIYICDKRQSFWRVM